MASRKIELGKLFPIFLTFIVMGFVDIVGVSTGYVQKDFGLSDTMAQFLPSMVFIWFFVFSIPIGILQDRLGKKKMMNIWIVITIIGMLIPFTGYSFTMAFIAIFIAGLGAGNLFPLVFSIAMNKMPSRSNEISGLLIMAIVGGAIVPPIMGAMNSNVVIHGSLLILVFCFAFILAIPFSLKQGST